MDTIARFGGKSGPLIRVLIVLLVVTVVTGLATASGLVAASGLAVSDAQTGGSSIGWRDIANALFGILLTVLSANVISMKKDIERRVDISTYNDSIRRIDHNETQIGNLFSKIHDEEVSRLKSHMDVMMMQNKNQSAILNTLASIASRSTNGNGHRIQQNKMSDPV